MGQMSLLVLTRDVSQMRGYVMGKIIVEMVQMRVNLNVVSYIFLC